MTIDGRDVVSGDAWDAVSDRVAALKDLLWATPGDEVSRADGFAYLLRFLAAGLTVCMHHDDTETPELGHMIHHRVTWGLDNPDCLYSYTRVDGNATYRLGGWIGTARHLELQVNTGHQSDGDFAGWRAVSALRGDDLLVDEDGRFKLTLSQEPQEGNWMALDPSASFLLVRQYFCDWEQEHPARLTIEREGFAYPPPLPSAERVAAQVGLLCDWLDTGARCWDGISRGILDSPPGDVTPFLPPEDASGLKGQAYGMGPWRCTPDQAVILELTPPACRMWGVSLCDRWWQSIDFARRQSSLNSCQAIPDADGVVRLVLAHGDPGVANWLDPGGHTEGTLAVRYLMPETVPTLAYRSVARDELLSHLPPQTSTLGGTTRSDVLSRRRRSVTRRYGS
jgi:hypothetical protein